MTTAALTAGSIVGPYRIVGELGNGGMGLVYRAVHTLLDRPAAIKVLRPELGLVAIASDRFLTEAKAATAIRHPGIVEVYDYGHTETGAAFIAMELLDGYTLHARLVERGTLSVTEALAIARRIAAPLQAAHERGVIHRDLKPDNVFLTRDPDGGPHDCVKILDFGIAKLQTPTAHRTTAGLVIGTPAYMSPEQCRGMQACDHRTDVYSLGCILYEMIVGEPPYGRTSSGTDMLIAHVSAPVPDIARFATVPTDVVRLITRMLAKRPEDRPHSAADVACQIDQIVSTRQPAPVARSRWTLRAALAAAAGLAVSLTGLGLWHRYGRTHPTIELVMPPASAGKVEPIAAARQAPEPPPPPFPSPPPAPPLPAPIQSPVRVPATHDLLPVIPAKPSGGVDTVVRD